MKQWHYAAFLIAVILLILIISRFLPEIRKNKEIILHDQAKRLFSYLKSFIDNGIIYDYSFSDYNFNSIRLEGDYLVVGGQCRIVDFLSFCINNDIFYPVGSFGYDKTISDEISKGSIGIFQRRYGMLTDYVESLEVVSSGGIFQCSKTLNPRLFWAIRGGGAENFGFITEVKFMLTKGTPQIQYFDLTFPLTGSEELIKIITGNKLTSNRISARIEMKKFTVNMRGLYFGIPRRLSRILNSLPDSWTGDMKTISYLEALNLTEEYSENEMFLKNYYLSEALNEEQIELIKNSFENIKGDFAIQFWTLGNAKFSSNSLNRGKSSIILKYTWDAGDNVDWQLDQMIALTQRLKLSTKNRCCLGLFDYQLRSHRNAYFGKRYRDLKKVKKIYDPSKLFESYFSL